MYEVALMAIVAVIVHIIDNKKRAKRMYKGGAL